MLTPMRARHSATTDPTLPTPTIPYFNRASFCCAASPQAEIVRRSSSRNAGGGSNSSWKVVSSPCSPTTRTLSHQQRSYIFGADFTHKRPLQAPSVPSVIPMSGKPVAALTDGCLTELGFAVVATHVLPARPRMTMQKGHARTRSPSQESWPAKGIRSSCSHSRGHGARF